MAACLQLIGSGVSVSLLLPGIMDTPMTRAGLHNLDPKAVRQSPHFTCQVLQLILSER